MLLLKKLIKINRVHIIGIFKVGAGDVYYSLEVIKKGSKIDFKFPEQEASVDELIKRIGIDNPAILIIDGKGIINKSINEKEEADHHFIKTLDPQTIYSTKIKVKDISLISFCRRNVVDDYVDVFQKHGLQIIDFYVGAFPTVFLHPTVNEPILYSNEVLLEFKDNVISNVVKGTAIAKEYKFGEQTLSNYHLPLYGAAIDFYLKLPETLKSKPDGVNDEEIIYKKGFELLGKGMLVFFLVALLVSYILIGHYSSKNMELNQQNVFSGQTLKHINELQKKKEQKLLLLSQTGYMSNQFLNFYTYELCRSVPKAVEINGLNIFPIVKEIKNGKKIDFDSKVIMCSGITTSETNFNMWLNALSTIKWIKKFEIISLKKDRKEIQHFEIKIIVL